MTQGPSAGAWLRVVFGWGLIAGAWYGTRRRLRRELRTRLAERNRVLEDCETSENEIRRLHLAVQRQLENRGIQ